MFVIAPDPLHPALINYRVWGLWEPGDALAFEQQAWAAIAELGAPPGRHRSLLDITDFKIQSQAVVQMCLDMVAAGIVGERCAFVIGAGLARIQVKRVIGSANIRQFTDARIARAWLLGENDDPGLPLFGPEAVGAA